MHPCDDDEGITGEFRVVFKQKGIRVYDKSIQAESIDQMGWLLYSSGKMDIDALSRAISERVGIGVGLRYKFINSVAYEADREERKKLMAIHNEVDRKDVKKADRRLKNYIVQHPMLSRSE